MNCLALIALSTIEENPGQPAVVTGGGRHHEDRSESIALDLSGKVGKVGIVEDLRPSPAVESDLLGAWGQIDEQLHGRAACCAVFSKLIGKRDLVKPKTRGHGLRLLPVRRPVASKVNGHRRGSGGDDCGHKRKMTKEGRARPYSAPVSLVKGRRAGEGCGGVPPPRAGARRSCGRRARSVPTRPRADGNSSTRRPRPNCWGCRPCPGRR